MPQTKISIRDIATASGVRWNRSVRSFTGKGSLNGSLAEALATLSELPPERWMGAFTQIYPGRSLHDFCLLGAHHAGMYQSDKQFATRDISTLTQIKPIYQQMRAGVRFLEMRLIEKKGVVRAYHGPKKARTGAKGPKLAELLNDVERFLTEERSEVAVVMLKNLLSRGWGRDDSAEAVLDVARRVGQALSAGRRNLRCLSRSDGHLIYSAPLPELRKRANLIVVLEGSAVKSENLPSKILGESELKMASTYTSTPKLGASDVRKYKRSTADSAFHQRVMDAFDKTQNEKHKPGRMIRMQLEVSRKLRPLNTSSILDLAEYANRHAARVLPGRLRQWKRENAKPTTDYENQIFPNVYFTDISHQAQNFRASQRVNRILATKVHDK